MERSVRIASVANGRQPATEKGAIHTQTLWRNSVQDQTAQAQTDALLAKTKGICSFDKNCSKDKQAKQTKKPKKQCVGSDALKLGKCGVYVGKIIPRIDSDYAKTNVEIHT